MSHVSRRTFLAEMRKHCTVNKIPFVISRANVAVYGVTLFYCEDFNRVSAFHFQNNHCAYVHAFPYTGFASVCSRLLLHKNKQAPHKIEDLKNKLSAGMYINPATSKAIVLRA